MKKLKRFLKTTLLGGIVVLLPVFLTGFLLNWMFQFITTLISPITIFVLEKIKLNKFLADVLVVLFIIAICFVVGLIVKTRFGRFFYRHTEKRILKIMPGYNLFKKTIKQFLGQEEKPFSRVVLVQPFRSGALMTGFVTDEHPDDRYTVFVPSGLNPTSGLIFHLKEEDVQFVNASVEDTMRSIIGCGAGSTELLEQVNET